MTRSDLQEKINNIRGDNLIKLVDLTPQMKTWLDTKNLAQDDLSHEFIRDHILDDLNSYEGIDFS